MATECIDACGMSLVEFSSTGIISIQLVKLAVNTFIDHGHNISGSVLLAIWHCRLTLLTRRHVHHRQLCLSAYVGCCHHAGHRKEEAVLKTACIWRFVVGTDFWAWIMGYATLPCTSK